MARATVVRAGADAGDIASLAAAHADAARIGSKLNALRNLIVGRLGVLLAAAGRPGVSLSIPADRAADFSKIRLGNNRSLDLRRALLLDRLAR